MRRVLLEMEKLKNPNSGLGQFCMNIGRAVQRLNPKELELDFYLPGNERNIFGKEANYIRQSSLHKLIPISSREYDIWHCLQQDSHYLPSNKNTKLILTIHDLNFLIKYKGSKQRRKLKSLQKRVDKAHAITVVSAFTEKVVRDMLHVNNTPIHVIYNGNSLKVNENAEKPEYINFENYFFSIGIIDAKKNFHVLLPLLEHFKNTHLVIAGDNTSPYAKQLINMALKANVNSRLHLVGAVSDDSKYWLYKNCKAFVFPSLTEGFGLPVVEAMSLGKPTFLSKVSSLPEVGGSEAYYWQNFEPQHIIGTVEKGLDNFTLDKEKANRSISWASQFSWENAAKAYLKLYQEI